jgi:hypothetical protein
MGCIPIIVQALPAVMVAGTFNVFPTALDVGETFTASMPVTNNGGSSGIATVDFTAGETTQTKAATIAAGGTEILSALFTAGSAGSLNVCGTLR